VKLVAMSEIPFEAPEGFATPTDLLEAHGRVAIRARELCDLLRHMQSFMGRRSGKTTLARAVADLETALTRLDPEYGWRDEETADDAKEDGAKPPRS
jgi:hypothetical protein